MTLPDPAMAEVVRRIPDEVKLGQEAETFLASPLGKYLAKRSEQQIQVALEEMKDVDPHEHIQIAALQHRIRVAASVPQWLVDIIQEGNNSEFQIREQEAEDATA